jgi:hypothetical protein
VGSKEGNKRGKLTRNVQSMNAEMTAQFVRTLNLASFRPCLPRPPCRDGADAIVEAALVGSEMPA